MREFHRWISRENFWLWDCIDILSFFHLHNVISDIYCRIIILTHSLLVVLAAVAMYNMMVITGEEMVTIMMIRWRYDGGIEWFRLKSYVTWRRHQMEPLSALLALCVRNSPITGEFPSQRPVTRSFNVFFHLRLNKQSRRRWLKTPPHLLWRHCNYSLTFYLDNFKKPQWSSHASINCY